MFLNHVFIWKNLVIDLVIDFTRLVTWIQVMNISFYLHTFYLHKLVIALLFQIVFIKVYQECGWGEMERFWLFGTYRWKTNPKVTQNFERCSSRDLWRPQKVTLIAPEYEFLAFFHVNIQQIKGWISANGKNSVFAHFVYN